MQDKVLNMTSSLESIEYFRLDFFYRMKNYQAVPEKNNHPVACNRFPRYYWHPLTEKII